MLRTAMLMAIGLCLRSAAMAQDACIACEPCYCVQSAECQGPKTLFSWREGDFLKPEKEGEEEEEDTIVTDRPDFTEASSTVGRCVFQIEMGYTYTYDNDGVNQTRNHSYPETLLRYGVLAEWFELRLGWNYGRELSTGIVNDGAEDLYLGAKIGLTEQAGWLPEMALMPQVNVPTGSRAFTADRTLFGINYLYGWDVNDFISTGGSTQFNRAVDGGSGSLYTEWAQSWTVGYSLTDKLGAYTEWYAFFPSGADTERTQHYFDGGFTYLLTNDVQWDIRAGIGLNEAADDYFVGSGLSIRFK